MIRGSETFYVRLAEEVDASLAPEVELHTALRAAGVRVPTVTHYEPFDQALARSVMVTTEVAGGPLDGDATPEAVAAIGRSAGAELALIHEIPVNGFGWVRREHGRPGWPLRGDHRTYPAYVDPPAAGDPLTRIGFDIRQARRVETLLEEAVELGPSGTLGSVAHGDFDAGHIFVSGSAYSGLIDFGEIRGTDYTFDFATACLAGDQGPYPEQLLRAVEQGYAGVRPLPDDHERRLYLACVLSASHRLCAWFNRDGVRAADGWFFRWIRDHLVQLLASGRPPMRVGS